ncbi:MAG: GNAT family N-acetyltransferase [Velocimicrobium sp.]
MVEFKKIDESNFEECMKLSVFEEQKKFVAENTLSMAQAYLAYSNNYCIPIPYAIYDEDTSIGFIMMAYHTKPEVFDKDELYDEAIYEIWRLMIDKRYQGKGYGKQSVEKALAYIKTYPCGEAKKIVLSFEPDNLKAKHLYKACGFVETGDVLEEEIVSVYEI